MCTESLNDGRSQKEIEAARNLVVRDVLDEQVNTRKKHSLPMTLRNLEGLLGSS